MHERDDRPDDLERRRLVDVRRDLVGRAAAVLDREDDDERGDQEREERRDGDQEAGRARRRAPAKRRGLLGEERHQSRRLRSRRASVRARGAATSRRARARAAASVARPAEPDDVHDHGAVLAGRRVVVEAEEQQLVDGRADRPADGLDERRGAGRAARTRRRRSSARGGRPASATTMPLACANCVALVVVAVAEADGLRRARAIDAASPVRKCQPAAAPGRS